MIDAFYEAAGALFPIAVTAVLGFICYAIELVRNRNKEANDGQENI